MTAACTAFVSCCEPNTWSVEALSLPFLRCLGPIRSDDDLFRALLHLSALFPQGSYAVSGVSVSDQPEDVQHKHSNPVGWLKEKARFTLMHAGRQRRRSAVRCC